jgi:putative pyruvate formate lyase activating enzyme
MSPSYLNLTKSELKIRIKELESIVESCTLCPRNCKVNRLKGERGFCAISYLPKISSYSPHFGEESVLVGTHGSGTIFFTSCNLACVYCQNYEISQLRIGKEIGFEELANMMLELQNLGCHNINLVTPTPQVYSILRALEIAIDKGLRVPIVYNTSAYDSTKTLKLLDNIVDIYMPDIKYGSNENALKYSNVKNYFDIAKEAVKEMYSQVGDLVIENGIAKKGLLVRHLVLPNNLANSEEVIKFIATLSKNTFINIMDQYYPCHKAFEYYELARRIMREEHERVIRVAKKYGLKRIYY